MTQSIISTLNKNAIAPILAILAAPAFSQVTNNTNAYIQHNLVSDLAGMADVTDPNLVNPWGVAESASSPFWVSDGGKGVATVYNGSGAILPLVVTVPPGAGGASPSTPTGQVSTNGSTNWVLANGKASAFIFSTLDGTISAWNGGTAAVLMVDNSSSHAQYNGLGINTTGATPMLYAPNFTSGKVDVFDEKFAPTTASGGFTDPNLPSGYAPYNIWNLGGKLYVTYGKQSTAGMTGSSTGITPGAGNGFVDVFDTNGNLLQRAASAGPLNAPWGVAIAPSTFGAFGGALLVGNFGDGKINAFDQKTGNSLGTLQNQSGNAIVISGLWALLFGNGKNGGDPNTLYFSAGINGLTHGLFGSIAPPAAVLSVSNAASEVPGPIAPGEVVVINGLTIGPSPLASESIPATGTVGATIGSTSVTFNGTPAPILYASASETAVVVPYEVAGSTTASVVVTFNNQSTSAFQAQVAASAPGLFTLAETGSSAAVAANSDGTINGASNAAAAGSAILLYATGEGMVDPPAQDGSITSEFFHTPVLPVSLKIGGQAAQVAYAGSAPGEIAGVMVVEAIVPQGAGTGAAPVVLTVGSASSQSGVTLFVK